MEGQKRYSLVEVKPEKKKKKQKQRYSTATQMPLQFLLKELKSSGFLHKTIFLNLISQATSIIKYEPNVIKIESPVVVVGDIHGQFYDLLNIFEKNGDPSKNTYLFLGDYVDRGMFGVQVLSLLLWYKVNFPNKIYLLRGNHECRTITMAHNFKEQCHTKYNINVYNYLMDMFDCLPLCCIVDDSYFCVHAGISPELADYNNLLKLNRFIEIPVRGVICDLMWSDPTNQSYKQWKYNSMRSCSYFYTTDQAQKFLKHNKLKMIIRGHEIQLKGFKYQKNIQKQIHPTLTIFSAPNYCDKYENLGAVAVIQNGQIDIRTFEFVQHPVVLPGYINIFQWSCPYIANFATELLLHLLSVKLKYKGENLMKKNVKQIKEQIEAIQYIQIMKKLNKEVGDTYSGTAFKVKEETQIGEVLKFFLLKEKDALQAYPQKKNQQCDIKEEESSENLSLQVSRKESSKSSEKPQVARTCIIGPKIKNFVKIRQKTEI